MTNAMSEQQQLNIAIAISAADHQEREQRLRRQHYLEEEQTRLFILREQRLRLQHMRRFNHIETARQVAADRSWEEWRNREQRRHMDT